VRHLVPFHHDPSHDDDMLDALYGGGGLGVADGVMAVTPAREGREFVI
jgi:hypothetical protein